MIRQLAGVTAAFLSLSLAGCGGSAEEAPPPLAFRAPAAPCACNQDVPTGGGFAQAPFPRGCYLPVAGDPMTLPGCGGAAVPDQLTREACRCVQEEVVGGELVELRFPDGCYTAASAGATDALPSCDPARPVRPSGSPPRVP